MRRRICFCVLLMLLFALLLTFPVGAAGDLDRILSYDVTVVPNNDASLNMTASISWKVLDSTSEGPLTWVKIGIPNTNVTDVTALDSPSVDHVVRSGEYIEVYFKDEYQAGEVVDFTVSWHQTHMFLQYEDGSVDFVYTPGWFDESVTEKQTIRWKRDPAAMCEMKTEGAESYKDLSDDEWIVLSASNVDHGGKLTLQVKYPAGVFTELNPEMDRSHADHDRTMVFVLIAVFVVIVLSVSALIWYAYRTQKDPDYWTGGYENDPVYTNPSRFWLFYGYAGHRRPHGGFVPPPGRHGDGGRVSGGKPISHSSSGSGGMHGGGCACACACACAGGGRAGCSKKDVVGAAARLSDVREAIDRGQTRDENQELTHEN